MCLWNAWSMGPEAVNSVLKYEEDGDRDLCSKPREIQLIAQPLAGVTLAFVKMLFREWPSDRGRWFSVQVLRSPGKVKFLDQIRSQLSQAQWRQWITFLPRSLCDERSSSIVSPSPKHNQPLWPQCHWLQVTAFNLIKCLLCWTNWWCAPAIKAAQWPGLEFTGIVNTERLSTVWSLAFIRYLSVYWFLFYDAQGRCLS